MGWVRIDDSFYDHPKHLAVSLAADGLWVTLLAWSNRNLTDGFIPTAQLRRFGHHRAKGLVGELARQGLVRVEDDGVRIHDFLEYQPPAAEIRARREQISSKRAAAGRQGGKQTASKRAAKLQPQSQPQPQPQSRVAASLAERLSTGCGFELPKCEKTIEKLRNEGIGELVLDEAIGMCIQRQPDSLGYFVKVARDWYQQRTGA